MDMIDILSRLKQIQESNPNVDVRDAIENVAKSSGKINTVVEKAKNPYAIGMAAAMKSTGDKPPLKKSTITKAHDIAKGIEKNEGETDEGNEFSQAVQKAKAAGMKAGDKFKVGDKEYTLKDDSNNEGEMDEAMTKKHFQHVADTLKQIEDPKKRAEYAKHHSAIFQHSNPRFDHAKFMKAAGVDEMEEGRVKDWLMDLESDANDMTRDEFIKKHGQSQAHVWDKVNKENKENEGKEKPDFLDFDKDGNTKEPMKKAIKDKEKKMNESIVIATDNPEEASMMMQLLKLAGVQPVDQNMINQPQSQEPSAAEIPAEEKTEEEFDNTPHTKNQSVDDLVNTHSGGLNKQKKQFRKEYPGDNPMAANEVTEEELSNSLRAQYEGFKSQYQAEAKSPKQKAAQEKFKAMLAAKKGEKEKA